MRILPQFVRHEGRRYLQYGQFDPRGGAAHMKLLARRNNFDPVMLARRQAWRRRRKTSMPVAGP
jgi:hypothetical protein